MQAEGLRIWERLCSRIETAQDSDAIIYAANSVMQHSEFMWFSFIALGRVNLLLRENEVKVKKQQKYLALCKKRIRSLDVRLKFLRYRINKLNGK